MYAVVNNGQVTKQLRSGQSFVHPTTNIQYVAGWWRNTTVVQKADAGIYPIQEGIKKDSKYYFNTAEALSFAGGSVVNRPYTSVAKDIDILKAAYDINRSAYDALKDTDWYIVREVETGAAEHEVPVDVTDFRRDVRAKANALTVELTAVTVIGDTVEDSDSLLKFVAGFTFPVLSDYPLTLDSDS